MLSTLSHSLPTLHNSSQSYTLGMFTTMYVWATAFRLPKQKAGCLRRGNFFTDLKFKMYTLFPVDCKRVLGDWPRS